MSTGLFSDEEDGYNLEEETKYKLKLDAPQGEPAFGGSSEEEEDLSGLEDLGGDDLGDDLGGDDKPFNDEPFDAGVEASEVEEPEKYIQQLSGKLGTSLRKYSEERGQPDFDLEKFAVNSVISATHTAEMSEEDQEDIIKKVKSSGAGDDGGEDLGGEEELGAEDLGGEEDLGGNGEELGIEEAAPRDTEAEEKANKPNLKVYLPKPGLDEGVGREAVEQLIEVIGILSAKLSNNYQDEENIVGKIESYITSRPKLAAWALQSDVIDAAINMMTNNPGESPEMDDIILKILYKLEVGVNDYSDTFHLNELTSLNNPKKSSIFTENMDIMDYIKNKVQELVDSEAEPVTKPTIAPTETPSPRRRRIWEPKPSVSPKPKAGR